MSFDAFWELKARSLPVEEPEALARAVWDYCHSVLTPTTNVEGLQAELRLANIDRRGLQSILCREMDARSDLRTERDQLRADLESTQKKLNETLGQYEVCEQANACLEADIAATRQRIEVLEAGIKEAADELTVEIGQHPRWVVERGLRALIERSQAIGVTEEAALATESTPEQGTAQ